jgi:periplasmic nitrate reductase NapD
MSDPTEMLHIASVLVHVRPADHPAVARWLTDQPDCEVRAEDPAGKLVVVVESLREARLLELVDAVQQRRGVLGAALIYHQRLDAATADDTQEVPS